MSCYARAALTGVGRGFGFGHGIIDREFQAVPHDITEPRGHRRGGPWQERRFLWTLRLNFASRKGDIKKIKKTNKAVPVTQVGSQANIVVTFIIPPPLPRASF